MAMTRWWKVASIVVALGAAGSGVGLLAQDRGSKPADASKPLENPQAADAPTIRVAPGKLSVIVSEKGVVEASRSRDVMCEVEHGTTIIMIRPEGTKVKVGEVVAELDSAALRDALVNQRIARLQAQANHEQAKLVHEIAESGLKEYVEGVLPRERETLKGRVAQAQAAIRKNEAKLERTRRARKQLDEAMAPNKGPVTPSDIVADLAIDDRLDDAELELSKQERDLERAKSEQDVLEKYTQEKTIKQLTINVDRAKADELHMKSNEELEGSKERKIERQIVKCTLKAPGDGILVHANDPNRVRGQYQIEEGAMVRERQKIFSVFNPDDPVRINAKVHESIVDRIKPGLRAQIRVDAVANEAIKGQVVSIAPMADANSQFASDIKVYTTFVALEGDTAKLNLRPGMSAQAEILVAELDDVPSVPVESVLKIDGRDWWAACETPEGKVEWRKLTFGMSNGKVVEIKEGLRPGDLVVIDPRPFLTPEMKAKLNEPNHPARRPR